MSRVAKQPITIPSGVTVTQQDALVTVKGPKGELTHQLHSLVKMNQEDSTIIVTAGDGSVAAKAQSGTARSILNNMVSGVTTGFEKKLQLQGVGYRAKVQGNIVEMTLGFSHPVKHQLPQGVTAECPSQTEVVVKGHDKQLVGQVAAELRRYRPPEPYKGKGVRYADENVIRKEAKKK